MHFVVCIKQVPDTMDIRVDPETNTLQREGVASIINPFDMYAIEEAIRLREKMGGQVTALSMGPPQAVSALREAISMGVNNAILLSDRAFIGSDTWATSYTLAMAIRKLGDYSVILCGKQASDGDTAQVGPGIAEHLDLPQITYVRKIESITPDLIVAERMLEEGVEVLEGELPCVLTVVKEINKPRLPSLKDIMRARKAVITHWQANDLACDASRLGLDGSLTKVLKIFSPPARSCGEILTGEADQIVPTLVERIKEAIIVASL
jgi:electron transfer flavoprotein alpha/beta subunit